MRFPWSAAATVVVACLVSIATPAHAAVDCGCTEIGDYLDPDQPASLVANVSGLSPHGKYQLTATAVSGSIQITIDQVSPPAPVLSMSIPPGSRWGFSPDDDRFSYHYLTGSIETTRLLDLTSVTPTIAIWEGGSNPVSSSSMFSPHGAYFTYVSIDATPQTFITIVDARTGEPRFQVSPLPYTGPGTPGDEYGIQSWGFSPDSTDRSFVYGSVAGPQWVDFNLVNLPAEAVVHSEALLSISAFWQFSPCGDALALVKQVNLSQAITSLYQTSDGDRTAERTDSDFNISLSTTSTDHVATVGATPHDLAPNLAGVACPASPTLKSLKVSPSSVTAGAAATGIATLTGAAPPGGALVTLGYAPAAASGPASVTIPAGQASKGFAIATADVPSLTLVTVSGTYSGLTKQDVLTITPVPAELNTLTLSSNNVLGGTPVSAYVALTKGAPAAGATVTLTSSNPLAATIDPNVVLTENHDQATVPVTVISVEAPDSTILTASYRSRTRTQKLVVRPVSLQRMRLTSRCVLGGDSLYAEVALDGPAGPTGAHIAMFSDAAAVTPPDTCVIPPGASEALCGIATHPVVAQQLVRLTASFRGAVVAESLTVFDELELVVRDLGTLYGFFDHSPYAGYYGHYSDGRHLNNLGQVIGNSEGPGLLNGSFKWSGGVLADLGYLGPFDAYSLAHGINDAGVVVGESENVGVIFDSGTVTDIPLVSGPARDINQAGHIVGGYGALGEAWFYDGAATSLGLLPGTTSSTAQALNDNDVVVGTAQDPSFIDHPFRWTAATGMVALPVPVGAGSCYPLDINDAGAIVGYCRIGAYEYAIAWQDTVITRLEDQDTRFLDVNNTGLTLGTSILGPTIWNGTAAFGILDALESNCDLEILKVYALNDLGQMAGSALVGLPEDDISHAVLINSTPTSPWMQSVTAATASARLVSAEPSRVSLLWNTHEIELGQVRVQRSEIAGGWEIVGVPSTAGDDRFTFVDSEVRPGVDYSYRLAVLDAGETRFVGMISVRTPAALALAIGGFFPNPAQAGDLTLSFSLPSSADARIEVFDVHGRRAVNHDAGGLAPGLHRVRLTADHSLLPGIYFVKLTQAGRSVRTRVAITR